MKSPVILFNLDRLYPWVPRIHEGLLEVAEAQGWRVILATYQGQRLINVCGAIRATPTLYAALVTANAEEASACAERSFPCVFIGSPASRLWMQLGDFGLCRHGANGGRGAAALKTGGFAKAAGTLTVDCGFFNVLNITRLTRKFGECLDMGHETKIL
ncbi:MAG: hypothetical protein JJT96_14005 [Opitutales bacterium]|nr:hypothetical protein [Opitutales bacterium]